MRLIFKNGVMHLGSMYSGLKVSYLNNKQFIFVLQGSVNYGGTCFN